MMVGDDHVEPVPPRVGYLLDGSEAAVDGEHAPDPLLCETPERVARDAVALLEPARQMPADVGSELTEVENRDCSRADPVDVVVPVHTDLRAVVDCRPDAVA